MNLDDIEEATARRAHSVDQTCGPYRPLATPTHAALLSNERSVIEAFLAAECRASLSFSPFDAFFVVVDLRGDFGRRLGLHVFDRVALDRRIRQALADGTLPSLSIPVDLDHGLALVELVAPEWLPWLDERPPLAVPMLVVDGDDVPRLASGRLWDGRLH
jgi:hypothetical protein